MTQEQIQEITDILKVYTIIDFMAMITILVWIPFVIVRFVIMFKTKKMQKEWYLTLTEEQKQIVNKEREWNKKI